MTSNTTHRNARQLEPTLALAQLLTLHPELPHATWTICANAEGLAGHCWDAPDGAMGEFVEALGGIAHEPWLNRKTARVSQVLDTVWQDVHVTITVSQSAIACSTVAA